MSMQNCGASGYVVKASEFTKLLPDDIKEKYTQAIENLNVELVDGILGENCPSQFPAFESAFILNTEDESDSLEHGIVYICFQDEDLFFQSPKPELEYLNRQGITPEFERWVTWG